MSAVDKADVRLGGSRSRGVWTTGSASHLWNSTTRSTPCFRCVNRESRGLLRSSAEFNIREAVYRGASQCILFAAYSPSHAIARQYVSHSKSVNLERGRRASTVTSFVSSLYGPTDNHIDNVDIQDRKIKKERLW